MKILVCYKDFVIGSLEKKSGGFVYRAMPGKKDFEKDYPFLNYSLKHVDHYEGADLPPFFMKIIEWVASNTAIKRLLKVDPKKHDYFDILLMYADLPQETNDFYIKKA